MQLYTSLVRLKQELNGGELPPMTPVPEDVQHIISPSFTIGLGGLMEDEGRGLRCPVRGCGKWFHSLTPHLNTAHARIGGAESVRRALSIPYSAGLVSQKRRESMADIMRTTHRRGRIDTAAAAENLKRHHARPGASRNARRVAAESIRTVNSWNLKDMCVAQVNKKLLGLSQQLRRTPTNHEAAEIISPGFVWRVMEVYGSWNNALLHLNLKLNKRRYHSSDEVLEALRAYHDMNGTLPSAKEADRATRTPIIPSKDTILRSFKAATWPEAMRRAAAFLNIYGGRYGLPERKAS